MIREPVIPPPRFDKIRRRIASAIFILGVGAMVIWLMQTRLRGPDELLNFSYDSSREYIRETSEAHLAGRPGQTIRNSHGGSVRQAELMIRGLRADMVTLATAADVEAISARTGLIGSDWRGRFPHDSSPYTSTIVFLVRPGNPKNVRDWDDLVRDEVMVVAPSPRVSGAGRWAFLAALAHSHRRAPGDVAEAERFAAAIYASSPVLEAGARSALDTFLGSGEGDVLLIWENEALRVARADSPAAEVVYPSFSILAEPAVAVVDRYADSRGTRKRAAAYLAFLFSPEGQEIAARCDLRPRDPEVAARRAHQFAKLDLVTITEAFGGWEKAAAEHFAPGGTFDRIHRFERLKRESF